MTHRAQLLSRRGASALFLAVVCLGCAGSSPFSSPFYGPGGPPFISPKGHSYWRRSEEHTSELQSRESISYAVFCLKKKIKQLKLQF